MRADGIVEMSPDFDHSLGLLERAKHFAIELFIAQLAIKAFAVTVLAGTAWHDLGGPSANGSDPLQQAQSNELRAVV